MTLYILKEVPKQWHENFYKSMLSNEFKITNLVNVFIWKNNTNKGCVIIYPHLDDIFILGNNDYISSLLSKC
jgi:putative aminopeptidase FrvX